MSAKRSRLVLPTHDYKNLLAEVHKRDNWKCRVCKSRKNLHCHHIVYRSHGGDDAAWNMITLCELCHNAVHGKFATQEVYLHILPIEEGGIVDANKDVKIMVLGDLMRLRRRKAA